jgi:hypothetical protein
MRRLFIALSLPLALAACSGNTPTTSPAVLTEPTSLTSAAGAPSLQAQGGAVTSRADFQQPVSIDVYSECLAGTFHITGTINGWVAIATTPDGYTERTMHADFSQLAAALVGDSTDVWTADPGSHEIWSRRFAPGDPVNIRQMHEGRTRFSSSTGAPNIRFVHRIQYVELPNGEVQLNDVTFEADCY